MEADLFAQKWIDTMKKKCGYDKSQISISKSSKRLPHFSIISNNKLSTYWMRFERSYDAVVFLSFSFLISLLVIPFGWSDCVLRSADELSQISMRLFCCINKSNACELIRNFETGTRSLSVLHTNWIFYKSTCVVCMFASKMPLLVSGWAHLYRYILKYSVILVQSLRLVLFFELSNSIIKSIFHQIKRKPDAMKMSIANRNSLKVKFCSSSEFQSSNFATIVSNKS